MKKFLKLFTALLSGVCIFSNIVFVEPVLADNVYSADLNYVSGKMYYSDLSSDGINVSYATNLQKLLAGDNTAFSKDIAVTAEILASDIYSNVKVSTAGDASDSADCTDETSIYFRDFNMDDVQIIDLSTLQYAQDADDVSRFAVSHKKVTDDGTEKEIIVVAVEGTNGTYAQWSSNYDVGTEEDIYPGEHSEWLDHDNHKGFDVTFRRVLASVNSYILQNVSSSAEKTILITGHSRGGAIANLLGKYFEDNPEYRSFTYTFAAPAVTTKADASASTVFNIINTDDTIPYFPLSSWGFKRYGTDISYNAANLTTQWKDLTGIDYIACSGSDIADKAGALASNRAELYVLNKETKACIKNFASEDEANAKIAEMKASLSELGFTEAYYTFEVTENTGSKSTPYTVNGYVSPAFLMQYLAGLASYSEPFVYMSRVVSILDCSKIKSYNAVASFMVYHYMNKSIIYAHCTYAYYLLAIQGKEEENKEEASGRDDGKEEKDTEETVVMQRLYNPNTGEHLFSSFSDEIEKLVSLGWQDEGTAWIAPAISETPVYRLYNPNSGDHHYTADEDERDLLVSLGWNYECIAWYSGGNVPVYRLYNPNTVTGTHHYTAVAEERDYLTGIGWQDENIGWYAISISE